MSHRVPDQVGDDGGEVAHYPDRASLWIILFKLAVLRSHGAPDTRFNGGVPVSFSLGDDASALPIDYPRHITLSPLNDQIVVTGHTRGQVSTNNRIGVARFIGLGPLLFSTPL
ncbi:MAG: hypothetical protein AAGJ52_09985 [Pseudomonadota bacterium]